jgi:hypothetical protein
MKALHLFVAVCGLALVAALAQAWWTPRCRGCGAAASAFSQLAPLVALPQVAFSRWPRPPSARAGARSIRPD